MEGADSPHCHTKPDHQTQSGEGRHPANSGRSVAPGKRAVQIQEAALHLDPVVACYDNQMALGDGQLDPSDPLAAMRQSTVAY
jgi:hypothetical protein